MDLGSIDNKDMDDPPIAASVNQRAKHFPSIDRRNAVSAAIAAMFSTLFLPRKTAHAAADLSLSPSWSDLRTSLLECIVTLQNLLDNWKNAVVDCRFADVPRELLETKN
jgi:hypothetical protein